METRAAGRPSDSGRHSRRAEWKAYQTVARRGPATGGVARRLHGQFRWACAAQSVRIGTVLPVQSTIGSPFSMFGSDPASSLPIW